MWLYDEASQRSLGSLLTCQADPLQIPCSGSGRGGRGKQGPPVLLERLFQCVRLATLTRSSGSIGRLTDQAFSPSSVEESLLFAGTLYSGFHSNITAGSFFLSTCSRSWENVNLLFKCPCSPSFTKDKEEEWSLFWEMVSQVSCSKMGPSLHRAGRSVAHAYASWLPWNTQLQKGRSQ